MAGSTLLFVGWLRERTLHRNRALFFQSFSHELMTPLTSLQMNADLLLEDHENHRLSEPQARQLVEDIRSQTRRLERRLRNIIETTRIENRKLELQQTDLELNGWVRDFLSRSSLIEITKTVSFSTSTPDEAPNRAAVDERYLDIVLENLLENAIKNGATHVEISVRGTKESVELRVKDDGRGIDPADLPSIFRMFYRGKQQTSRGSGLGLSVTRQIVKLHGGRIFAASEGIGHGAEFTIQLPRSGKGAS
jgi:two-component system CheB/CheR fusion protein